MHVDVDTHVEHLHEQLVERLEHAFPLQKTVRRKSHVSDASWQLLRSKHAHRRALRYMMVALSKQLMADMFYAWKACRCALAFLKVGRGLHRRRINAARAAIRIRQLGSQLKAHLKLDMANQIKKAVEDSRDQGPAQMAFLIRSILKQGRKFRAPRTASMIKLADGRLVSNLHETCVLLGDHFAKAERCDCRPQWVAEHGLEPVKAHPEVPFDKISHLPTLQDLANAFIRMPCGKSAGLRNIPPEAFRFAPLESALLFYPVLLKMAVGGIAPQAMRKVWVIPMPKPNKPVGSIPAWRSIALVEPSMKAIARSIRQKMIDHIGPHFMAGKGLMPWPW